MALIPDIWYPQKGPQGEGFNFVPGDPGNISVIVRNCSNCALFRRRRAVRTIDGYCGCEDTKIYRLDEDIDLSLYHKLMEEQLRTHEIFFRKHFLQVVWRYPESHDACLRIVVGIKCDEVNVKSVQIGRFDLKLREGAMWREPIETRDKVVDWTKEIVDWNREADKRDNWPKYARIGFIVIEFEVIFPRWNLQFDLVMEVPLKESEVGEGGKDLDPLGWDWAYELADVLSDNQPTWESLTFINYLGSLPHPL